MNRSKLFVSSQFFEMRNLYIMWLYDLRFFYMEKCIFLYLLLLLHATLAYLFDATLAYEAALLVASFWVF